jgi:hypothetical protein
MMRVCYKHDIILLIFVDKHKHWNDPNFLG